MNRSGELEYYLDSLINTTNKSWNIQHKEDYITSKYLQMEYNKCQAKIKSLKNKIHKLIVMEEY